MKRLVCLALLALAFTRPLAAQEAPAQDVSALAREYVALPAMQEMMSEMFSPAALSATIEANAPKDAALSPAQKAAIGATLAETMAALRPRMEQVLAEASARHFTAAELQALIDFYGTETGAAVAKKMQPFFQDAMTQMLPALQQAMVAAGPKIEEIVRSQP